MLDTKSWEGGLDWSVVDKPSVNPLMETGFPPLRNFNWQYFLGYGEDSELLYTKICLALAWEFCHSLCEFIRASVMQCLEKFCFLEIIHYLWLLESFFLQFHMDSWALKGEVWYRHPCQSWAFQSLFLASCWQVVGLFVSYSLLQEEAFLMRVSDSLLFYCYSSMSPGCFLLLY